MRYMRSVAIKNKSVNCRLDVLENRLKGYLHKRNPDSRTHSSKDMERRPFLITEMATPGRPF